MSLQVITLGKALVTRFAPKLTGHVGEVVVDQVGFQIAGHDSITVDAVAVVEVRVLVIGEQKAVSIASVCVRMGKKKD